MSAPFGQQIYQDVTNGIMYPINTTNATISDTLELDKTSTSLISSQQCILFGAPSSTVPAAFSGMERNTFGDVTITAGDNIASANSCQYAFQSGPEPGIAVGVASGGQRYWLSKRATDNGPAGPCTNVVLTIGGGMGLVTHLSSFYMRINGFVFIWSTVSAASINGGNALSTLRFQCDQLTFTHTATTGASGGMSYSGSIAAVVGPAPGGSIAAVIGQDGFTMTIEAASANGNGSILCMFAAVQDVATS